MIRCCLAVLIGLWPMTLVACQADLQVPATIQVSPWEAEGLARGESLQVNLQVRLDARACAGLALGASYSGERPAGIRSSPNGDWIGLEAGVANGPLALPVADVQNLQLTPVLEWSGQARAVPAGLLQGRLRWRLYSRQGVLDDLLLERETLVLVEVPAILAVQLSGPHGRHALGNGPTLLDLGVLQSGTLHALLIEVSGNSRARVSVDARYGELRLEGRDAYRIPYEMRLDGKSLPADVLLAAPDDAGGIAVARLDVIIGEVERRAAGVYVDVLTLTVAPE